MVVIIWSLKELGPQMSECKPTCFLHETYLSSRILSFEKWLDEKKEYEVHHTNKSQQYN